MCARCDVRCEAPLEPEGAAGPLATGLGIRESDVHWGAKSQGSNGAWGALGGVLSEQQPATWWSPKDLDSAQLHSLLAHFG